MTQVSIIDLGGRTGEKWSRFARSHAIGKGYHTLASTSLLSTFGTLGQDTPLVGAEVRFFTDPEPWRHVINSDVPLVVPVLGDR